MYDVQKMQQESLDAPKPLNDHLDALSEKYFHTKTAGSWFVIDAKKGRLSQVLF